MTVVSEICHVCGKKKHRYTVFINNDNPASWIQYKVAREGGPICKKCDTFFAITGELRAPSVEEFSLAIKAIKIVKVLSKWWGEDKEESRDWPGERELVKLFINELR
jgi:hypothetical protein